MLSYQINPIFKVLRSLSVHLVFFTTKYFLPSLTDTILQSHALLLFDCQTRTTLLPSQHGIQPLKPLQSCFSFLPQAFPLSARGEWQQDVAVHPPYCSPLAILSAQILHQMHPWSGQHVLLMSIVSFRNKSESISFNVQPVRNDYYLEHAKLFMYLIENQKMRSPTKREKIQNCWSTRL